MNLPDDLLIAAKKRAAERRTTLTALLEAGLRAELARDRSAAQVTSLRLVTVDGALDPGLDLADREAVGAWLDADP